MNKFEDFLNGNFVVNCKTKEEFNILKEILGSHKCIYLGSPYDRKSKVTCCRVYSGDFYDPIPISICKDLRIPIVEFNDLVPSKYDQKPSIKEAITRYVREIFKLRNRY